MSRFSALIFAGALALSVAAPTLLAADKESPGVRNVVLVHGAWADASSWAKVIPLLEKAGLNVVAVQKPPTSFAADVPPTKTPLALRGGAVMPLWHSRVAV